MAQELACEEGHPEIIKAAHQDWQRDLFGPEPHFTVLVAERDGEIAGMLIYGREYYPGWTLPAIKIHDLYVMPKHRRQRVATTLLDVIATAARESKVALMHLNVRDASLARKFYSFVGFQPVPECLTYLMALPALNALTEVASDLPGFL